MANTTYLSLSYTDSARDGEKRQVVPVGLQLRPTSLSITFVIEQDEFHTSISCGKLYKSFWQDSLSEEVQCNLECGLSESLFTSAISSFTNPREFIETLSEDIKSALKSGVEALDNNPTLDFKLMAITVPDHWDKSARALVATAAKLAGQPLDGSHMILPLSRAVQSVFQMSRYSDGRYLTLLLDYNKSHLHMILVEMRRTDCAVKRQVYLPSLGEDELHKAPNDHQNVPDKFTTRRPICNNQAAHFKPVVDTISEFMIQMAVPKTSNPNANLPVPSHSASDLKNAVRGIRYIVIDGEASCRGQLELCDEVESKFVNEIGVNIQFQRGDCGALGAILVARRQLQNPKHLGNWKDLPEYVTPFDLVW